MPADTALLSGLGSGGPFRPAEGCTAFTAAGVISYMSHQGDGDSFLLADARTRDGTAAVRVVTWRCVHCGALLAGLGDPAADPGGEQEYTWLQSGPDQPGAS